MANKLALVTGASRTNGLGAAICEELASKGADVVFTYWHAYDQTMPWGEDTEGPAAIQEKIESYGRKALALKVNLESQEEIENLFAQIEAEFTYAPNILVNNAAVSINDNIQSVTAENLDQHYKINVRAVVLLIQTFLEHLERSRQGRIINIATGWSRGQMPEEISYVVTKSAAETLVHTISHQLARRGVTINAVNPGPSDTGWMTEELKKELLPLFPQGRIGKPSDAAKAVAYLAGEEAGWITGQVLHSEGGFLNGDGRGEDI
ncbi:SDR family oxidoreductase [Alkalicoccus daliensis]|uniref:3-oxoacyl-[acyl-carrier protein] reductase n=1 Tax=Alkalicoccus daliensis TaxID=745820 RepID=A0A1H0ITF4_9BACI|nr:SDR family oxidoreductase [Alkalicoccus daliensis]SDO34728.1 3-oxoacyl-[acyl-carrier protein] reductase [Alkalicoccus daliensis]